MKSFPKIKICGITRIVDAQRSAKLGADYLGLIMYKPSPRFVTQKISRSIIEATVPTIQFVLVFVNESCERVISMARRLRCGIVQLHGNYTASEISKIQRAGLKVIRAFQVANNTDLIVSKKSKADFILLDNKIVDGEEVYGGSGKAFDWTLMNKKKNIPANLILAGGLSADNFMAALDIVSPLILDFNSKVESTPGVKSAAKLKELFAALEKRRQN